MPQIPVDFAHSTHPFSFHRMKETTALNKDLILREQLAMERTQMANDRTLLSFIRTALYFAVAGITLQHLLPTWPGTLSAIAFGSLALLLLFIGIRKYRQINKRLLDSHRHIGQFQLNWEED